MEHNRKKVTYKQTETEIQPHLSFVARSLLLPTLVCLRSYSPLTLFSYTFTLEVYRMKIRIRIDVVKYLFVVDDYFLVRSDLA